MTLTKWVGRWGGVGRILVLDKSDFVDSTVVEMKNNGTYYALSERFPDYSDADLVRYYLEHHK